MKNFDLTNRYEMEEYIYEMMDEYRAKYNPYLKAWEAIAAISGVSRNAVYNILGANKNARLDTIVRLASTLEMNHEDFIILLMYNGLC